MRTFKCHHCQPSTRLFYDNTQCMTCLSEVGWCPVCQNVTALTPDNEGGYRCGNPACQAALVKCFNNSHHGVCNRLQTPGDHVRYGGLCDCCRHNTVIPDLSIEGHRERWAALEAAKRRLFYTLDVMGLPHPAPQDESPLPLTFAFMADALPDKGLWRAAGSGEKVYTGHASGHITINLKEADDVERERLRIDFNEPQRTLIGHFRHEIGHYYWDLLVKGQEEEASRQVFGNHDEPTYAEALERYYESGPTPNWWNDHVSAYATMHPWEDFAETFSLYEDIVSVLDTATNMGVAMGEQDGGIDKMIVAFQEVGVAINELNREMGLVDILPVVITPTIRDKLAYVHDLVERSRVN
ncbi:zinc-binding metallopeptidase family protein [Salinicola aestuarinus]|uniref:zinc-binding metallopeptidase family protein n=1 Tax=Salinicola aestuarinus TaxID=1949082 RepID=UPI000DA25967|nr:putative zinc-binding metallopeptidase [Salinicola aestuarinus]